jgi:hypothetical protein
MRWQAERGVLRPLDGDPPGSPWWRAVNDRLLLDGCEAMARSGGLMGERSSATIDLWMSLPCCGFPRLQALYEWSAGELGLPGLRKLVRDGSPIYAWSYADRQVWKHPREPLPVRVLRIATSAR